MLSIIQKDGGFLIMLLSKSKGDKKLKRPKYGVVSLNTVHGRAILKIRRKCMAVMLLAMVLCICVSIHAISPFQYEDNTQKVHFADWVVKQDQRGYLHSSSGSVTSISDKGINVIIGNKPEFLKDVLCLSGDLDTTVNIVKPATKLVHSSTPCDVYITRDSMSFEDNGKVVRQFAKDEVVTVVLPINYNQY